MQKKSLLVALFFGALCLTGCLKNEESASVAQVRIAKAEELKASAALKNAKAQAEVIYANAEATLKQAQAALLNAQAETEKVRAELLKVRVKLAEVLVEEEKVELLKKQAELEVLLAQYEAEKQDWINQLNNLLAQAEIDALQNAHDVLDAIAAFEENNMEDAQYYAYRYYDALQQVQALELQQLAIKAEKALVQAGVKAAKKSLNFELEQIDKQIAENKEMIAALQARQYMTAEEAEAALKEARIALSEAYSDYQDVLLAENAAWDAYNAIDSKKALFLNKWPESFVNFVYNHTNANPGKWSGIGNGKSYFDYEDYNAVWYVGYTNEKKEFVKLWKEDQELYNHVLYPSVEEQSVRDDFFGYDEMQIAPAEIFYENIEAFADQVVADKQAEIDNNVKALNAGSAAKVAALNATIKANEEKLALDQKYVDERKAAVTKAEGELQTALDEYNKTNSDKKNAQQEYQDYMVVKYNISRTLFEKVFDAEADTLLKSTAYVNAKAAYDRVKKSIKGLETAVTNAEKEEATAKGKYEAADAAYTAGGTAAMVATAKADWDPDFKYEVRKNRKDGESYYVGTKAGAKQANWLTAYGNEHDAELTWEAAKAALAVKPTDETLKAAEKQAHDDYTAAVAETSKQKVYMDAAESTYKVYLEADKSAKAVVTEAEKEWSKKFDESNAVAKLVDGKWTKGTGDDAIVAGSSQAATLTAQNNLADANADIVTSGDPEKPTTYDKMVDAKAKYDGAKTTFNTAFANLTAALKVKEADYKKDTKAEELYKKQSQSAKDWSTVEAKFIALTNLYFVAPDEPYKANSETHPMGWIQSNYNLDKTFAFVSEIKNDKVPAYIVKKTANKELNDDAACSKSISAVNAALAAQVAGEPAALAKLVANEQAKINDIKDEVAKVKAALAELKGYEADYDSWVNDRMEAYDDCIDAEIVSHEAWKDYIAAKAVYTALEDIAQQKVYVYDPENDDANIEGFVELTISEEIERLQGTSAVLNECVAGLVEAAAVSVNINGDLSISKVNISAIVGVLQDYAEEYGTSIVGLNVVKKLLEKVLEYGDVVESIVLEMLDERLEWNDEQIAILNVVAAKYQSLMNMYLGIDAVDVLGAPEEE